MTPRQQTFACWRKAEEIYTRVMKMSPSAQPSTFDKFNRLVEAHQSLTRHADLIVEAHWSDSRGWNQ